MVSVWMTGTHLPGVADSEIFYQTEGCLFGAWKNVFVAVWTTSATPALTSELGRVTETFSRVHPNEATALERAFRAFRNHLD